jgi:hypothetical protein
VSDNFPPVLLFDTAGGEGILPFFNHKLNRRTFLIIFWLFLLATAQRRFQPACCGDAGTPTSETTLGNPVPHSSRPVQKLPIGKNMTLKSQKFGLKPAMRKKSN